MKPKPGTRWYNYVRRHTNVSEEVALDAIRAIRAGRSREAAKMLIKELCYQRWWYVECQTCGERKDPDDMDSLIECKQCDNGGVPLNYDY